MVLLFLAAGSDAAPRGSSIDPDREAERQRRREERRLEALGEFPRQTRSEKLQFRKDFPTWSPSKKQQFREERINLYRESRLRDDREYERERDRRRLARDGVLEREDHALAGYYDYRRKTSSEKRRFHEERRAERETFRNLSDSAKERFREERRAKRQAERKERRRRLRDEEGMEL